MTGKPAISGAIHDLQARLGSIRLAVTAVAGLDLDAETRNEMLTSASEEAVRASAELAGVGALAACALEGANPQRVDVGNAIREAADTATLAGLAIDVSGHDSAFAIVPTERLVAVFCALMRVVGGAGNQIGVVTTTGSDRTAVHIERLGEAADTQPLPPIVDYLLDAIGATREPHDAGLAFSFGTAA